MTDRFGLLMLLIEHYIFTGFALYTICFVITTLFFRKNEFLKQFDASVCRVIVFAGLFYISLWLFSLIHFLSVANAEEYNSALQRMFGRYWFGFWLQAIVWFAATQLLRFKKIRAQKLLRIIIALPLLVSIERFVIIVISIHRDYLPSSWTMFPSGWDMLFSFGHSLLFFVIITGGYFIIRHKLYK